MLGAAVRVAGRAAGERPVSTCARRGVFAAAQSVCNQRAKCGLQRTARRVWGWFSRIMRAMLENIRQRRRLHTVVLTVFTLLWLVAMLSGVRVRAMPMPVPMGGDTALAAMQHSLCISDAALSAGDAEYAAWLEAALQGSDAPAPDPDHSEHAGPHCLLCVALMAPAAFALQVVPYPEPAHPHRWKQPPHFPPALQISAPLPPRGPPPLFLA